MPLEVFGRDAELASLHSFVAGISAGACALSLEGEAGMGKTTLWSAGVRDAEERELLVLTARPSVSETALSFSGLGDLLDPVLDGALEPLPSAQRRALSRALVLGEEEGPTPDPHAVGVAVLNAFRGLAAAQPVLVAVDDVQWLDAASSGALAYAARRLGSETLGVLVARRSGLESGLLVELRRALPSQRFAEIDVGPLDPGALRHVVRGHLDVILPRPLLAEVHQAAGGNPFYALEIVRMLRRSGASVEAGPPLPVPESLHDLVHARLLALPAESRDFLLAAAAHAHPTVTLTERATGVSLDLGLTPALEARVVDLEGERIRFTHPLLAASAYEMADPRRRREIHSQLATLLEDPEARAWQLAASVDEPAEGVALALEEAAYHAQARGALRPAALLLDRARELTPAERRGEAVRRGVEAAYLHFESGDARRAEAQLRDLIASSELGPHRAKALWVLARIRTYEAPTEAAELFLQVVREAGENRELLAAAHEGVASSLYYALEQLGECARHADVALALARELGDEALEGDVLVSKLGAQTLLGHQAARATAERAQTVQESARDRRLLDQPLLAVAEYWTRADEPERAREAFTDLLRQAEEIGDESSRPYLLFLLGEAECALGDLDGALGHGREGREAAEQCGLPLFAAYNLALESVAHAYLGNAERARDAARRALALMAGSVSYVRLVASSAMGHLEHAAGAPERVVQCLAGTLDFVRREAIVDPGELRFVVDYVEALIELGRRYEAAELLDSYEGNGRRLERASALANGARCRGLLSAQEGRLDEALATFEEALEWHAQIELPLDRARTLLALGVTQRRAKRRREARETLGEALAVFERTGAALWAERARAELRRISGRAPMSGALTPAEERVAALVAEGKTNKEVAVALFLSDRTVEGHLAHVFGKLGIRHRTELAAALQTRGIAGSNTGDSPVSADSLAP